MAFERAQVRRGEQMATMKQMGFGEGQPVPADGPRPLSLRPLTTAVVVAELRLRLPDVERTIARLEDAQTVSQESLRLEMSI